MASRLENVADAYDEKECTAEHNRLFLGNVICPINEAGYIRRDKGAILADAAGFYRAFGFSLPDDAGERVDHLVGELEFLALLRVMSANARIAGHADEARVADEAASDFVADHLGEWLPLFAAAWAALPRSLITANSPRSRKIFGRRCAAAPAGRFRWPTFPAA
ncbi:MAG: molecular chaperone TorD family protein [Deltaproteobacteria bacterium]|nr:molecular chaperone TorD family protein [Deltaproteobacteria bacterium]